MNAPIQEGTNHLFRGRSSDLLPTEKLSLLTRIYKQWHFTLEGFSGLSVGLKGSSQRPDRPGVSPEFPVHELRLSRKLITTDAGNMTFQRSPVNSREPMWRIKSTKRR